MESSVRDFYKGKSIFVTGGTGLLGVLTIEKLLRCCEVKEIFVLVRDKKGQSWQERIQKLCEDEVFNLVRGIDPDFRRKIVGINGDCGLIDLGINSGDRLQLCQSVNVVFHCAALVNMEANLNDSLNVNVEGTQRIIDLCREMQQLQVLLYVSTWYSNINQPRVEERFYEEIYSSEQLKQLNEFEQVKVSKALINSYCLTKNLAEHTLRRNASDLPVVIVRPPIVVPTRDEPCAGWSNNVWGSIGVIVSMSLGIWKVGCVDPDIRSPFIPADLVINEMIAAAWDTAVRKPTPLPIIYNCIIDKEKLLLLKEYFDRNVEASQKFPSVKAIGAIEPLKIFKNFLWLKIMWFFCHTIPAVFVDTMLVLQGKKPKLRRIYKKLYKVQETLLHFCFNVPEWTTDNSKALWDRMTATDQEWLNFDLRTFDWPKYIESSTEGMRYYLLKDDPSTLPEARKRQVMFRKRNFLGF